MRLIDADALEREYQEQYKLFTWDDGEREKATLARVIQMLHEQPTIEERKSAYLIDPNPYGKCSNCGQLIDIRDEYNFCPSCGARMEGNT